MALPPVGSSISLSQIQSEWGGSNPISRSEYYGKGNAPSSGAITMSADFGGTDNSPPSPQTFSGAGTSTLTIASNVQAIGVQVVGAGGGGGGAGGMFAFRGGGGGAGGNIIAYFNVSAGQTVTAIRGSGGPRGYINPNPNRGGPGQAGQSSSVKVGSTTIATGNGGGGGVTEPPTGGSGGGTSHNGSAYNVTANTGNAGQSGPSSFHGGSGGSSPVGSAGAGGNNTTGSNGGIGAGGGGAGSNMGIRHGGNGGAGYVKVTFYTQNNPTPDLSF